jgi:hypothetical protein
VAGIGCTLCAYLFDEALTTRANVRERRAYERVSGDDPIAEAAQITEEAWANVV